MANVKMKPFMAYLGEAEYASLRKFAKRKKIPMTQVIREAIIARVAPGNPYVAGFNAGVKRAIDVTSDTPAAKMRFPSGASFAELMIAEFEKLALPESEAAK